MLSLDNIGKRLFYTLIIFADSVHRLIQPSIDMITHTRSVHVLKGCASVSNFNFCITAFFDLTPIILFSYAK